jgi:hypothetical protein
MDDDEIHLHVTYASHLDMDEAFCARMRMASGTGECADWRCHYAWNQKSQIRPSRALAASFLAGRYGACLKGRSEQSFGTIVDGHAPGEPPSPSPSITRRRTPAALAVGGSSFSGHPVEASPYLSRFSSPYAPPSPRLP